jgi:hypothetical protein
MLQGPLKTCMQASEMWTDEWAGAWQQQGQHAAVYTQATLAGGLVVSSTAYKRLQTRNGSRVVVYYCTGSAQNPQDTPFAAEVDMFVELSLDEATQQQQQQDAPATVPVGSSSSSSSEVARFAILRVYKSQRRVDNDLADLLLEAKEGDFEKRTDGSVAVRAIPLHLIHNGLHTCKRQITVNSTTLMFVEVSGRSKRPVYALP